MTEEEEKKAREDRAKADAEAGEKLDKLLSHMDSFGSRMDAIDKRLDAYDEKEKARTDAERAKADADAKAKEDPDNIAADKKRKDAEEAEKKASEEKAKADAEAETKAKEEEEKKRSDAARADSASFSDIKAEIAALKARTPRLMTDDDHATFSTVQARADGVYQMFGGHAPPPMQSEDLNAYRLRLASAFQSHSPRWKDANLVKVAVDSTTLTNAEDDIYEAARRAALDPADVPEGRERVVTRVDRETNRRTLEFARKDSFVKDFGLPPQYITKFITERPN